MDSLSIALGYYQGLEIKPYGLGSRIRDMEAENYYCSHQKMRCTYQKTPENGVQVFPILDQN